MEVNMMFKKLIVAGVGIMGTAVSTLPTYACAGYNACGMGTSGCGFGRCLGAALWTLPWTPFSWGFSFPL